MPCDPLRSTCCEQRSQNVKFRGHGRPCHEDTVTQAVSPVIAWRYQDRSLAIYSERPSYHPVRPPLQSCRLPRSRRNLARGERLLRTPGTRAYVTQRAPAAAGARGAPATPAGVRIVIPILSGGSLRSPRLSSFRHAGAEFGTTEAVALPF